MNGMGVFQLTADFESEKRLLATSAFSGGPLDNIWQHKS